MRLPDQVEAFSKTELLFILRLRLIRWLLLLVLAQSALTNHSSRKLPKLSLRESRHSAFLGPQVN